MGHFIRAQFPCKHMRYVMRKLVYDGIYEYCMSGPKAVTELNDLSIP